MTSNDTQYAELRGRAEVLYGWYPDKHVPMDTLEFAAKSHGLIRDLLAALDAAEQRNIELNEAVQEMERQL